MFNRKILKAPGAILRCSRLSSKLRAQIRTAMKQTGAELAMC